MADEKKDKPKQEDGAQGFGDGPEGAPDDWEGDTDA